MAGNPKPKHGAVVEARNCYWTYDSAGLWRARATAAVSGLVLRRARWGSRVSDELWVQWMKDAKIHG